MKTINLKDYYPYYKEDTFIEVSDEVAAQMEENNHADEAYRIRTLRNKAYYSLDMGDQIERESIISHAPSVDDVYEHQKDLENMNRGLDDSSGNQTNGVLTEKQLRRILKFYYDEMSFTEIAEQEDCNWSSVRDTIERGLNQLKKYLEKN